MTGRRRAERRATPETRWAAYEEQRREEGNRREFLRRFSDLAAELEALRVGRDRENVLATLALRLRDRGVET